MTRTEAKTLIEQNARRTLIVRFFKRTDGKLRRMVCIYYPEAAAKVTYWFNPAEKGLVAVWDCEKGARRFINLDGVESVKVGGWEVRPYGLSEEETARHHEAAQNLSETSALDALDAEMDALFNTFGPRM